MPFLWILAQPPPAYISGNGGPFIHFRIGIFWVFHPAKCPNIAPLTGGQISAFIHLDPYARVPPSGPNQAARPLPAMWLPCANHMATCFVHTPALQISVYSRHMDDRALEYLPNCRQKVFPITSLVASTDESLTSVLHMLWLCFLQISVYSRHTNDRALEYLPHCKHTPHHFTCGIN